MSGIYKFIHFFDPNNPFEKLAFYGPDPLMMEETAAAAAIAAGCRVVSFTLLERVVEFAAMLGDDVG